MDSQDKQMCAPADNNHEVYDADCLGDILGFNILDFPVESLEGDGLTEDWALQLGPIPSEVFQETLTPVSHGGGDGHGRSADLLTKCCGLNMENYEPKHQQRILKDDNSESLLKMHIPTSSREKKLYRIPRSFEAPSPDSVLERRSSTSARKTVSFGTEIVIPIRSRTKRSRSGLTCNPWSKSLLLIPLGKKMTKKKKKRRNLTPPQPVDEIKKCSHCEITKTPQWREGPMGPKTLCNACGVRYRSGRLFPEYRPAASPTFIPSLHSNSHKKVIEMRQKGAGIGLDANDLVKKHLTSNSTYTRLCSS